MNLSIYISNLKCFEKYEDANVIFQLSSTFEHTMSKKLDKYVEGKVHYNFDVIKNPTFVTTYTRDFNTNLPTINEQTNKLFNYYRPTYNLETGEYNIFPGRDYLLHYKLLYSYQSNKTNGAAKLQNPREISLPGIPHQLIWDSLKVPTNLNKTVILGYAEAFHDLEPDAWGELHYDKNYEFGWWNHVNKPITLLGCYHSYWGDISSVLIHKLASYGVENVLYIGKLTSLNGVSAHLSSIVSGNISYLKGEIIDWGSNNLCGELNLPQVRHYTLPSHMLETKAWAVKSRTMFDITDSKIGYMAKQSINCGIKFGYIGLITRYLFNEENELDIHEFKSKKRKSFSNIKDLVKKLPI
jgi:hypothetical protein